MRLISFYPVTNLNVTYVHHNTISRSSSSSSSPSLFFSVQFKKISRFNLSAIRRLLSGRLYRSRYCSEIVLYSIICYSIFNVEFRVVLDMFIADCISIKNELVIFSCYSL